MSIYHLQFIISINSSLSKCLFKMRMVTLSSCIDHQVCPILYYHMLTSNAQLKSWWKDTETSNKENKIEQRVSAYGFNLIFSNPTHLLRNSKQNLNNRLYTDIQFGNSREQIINHLLMLINANRNLGRLFRGSLWGGWVKLSSV